MRRGEEGGGVYKFSRYCLEKFLLYFSSAHTSEEKHLYIFCAYTVVEPLT